MALLTMALLTMALLTMARTVEAERTSRVAGWQAVPSSSTLVSRVRVRVRVRCRLVSS